MFPQFGALPQHLRAFVVEIAEIPVPVCINVALEKLLEFFIYLFYYRGTIIKDAF